MCRGHPSHQECRYSRRAVFGAWGVRDDPFPVSHTGATALLAPCACITLMANKDRHRTPEATLVKELRCSLYQRLKSLSRLFSGLGVKCFWVGLIKRSDRLSIGETISLRGVTRRGRPSLLPGLFCTRWNSRKRLILPLQFWAPF